MNSRNPAHFVVRCPTVGAPPRRLASGGWLPVVSPPSIACPQWFCHGHGLSAGWLQPLPCWFGNPMILRLSSGWLLRGPAAEWPPFARRRPAVDWATDSSEGRPRRWNSAMVGGRVAGWTQWCAHGKGAPLLGRHPSAMSYSDGSLTAAWPAGIQSAHCSRRAARGTPSLEGGSTVRGSAHAHRDYRGGGCADRWNPHRCGMTCEAVAHLEDDDRFGGCPAVGSPTWEWASTESGTGYSVFHRGLPLGFVGATGTSASRPAAHCQQGAYGSGSPRCAGRPSRRRARCRPGRPRPGGCSTAAELLWAVARQAAQSVHCYGATACVGSLLERALYRLAGRSVGRPIAVPAGVKAFHPWGALRSLARPLAGLTTPAAGLPKWSSNWTVCAAPVHR